MTANFNLQTSPVKRTLLVLLLLASVWLVVLVRTFMQRIVVMPGRSFSGDLPAMTGFQISLRESLAKDVAVLEGFGPRHPGNYPALAQAAAYIQERLRGAKYAVGAQPLGSAGLKLINIEAEKAVPQQRREVVIIGAHYDSVPDSPGADDNASGMAVLLSLADAFEDSAPVRSVRFVAFVNGAGPHAESSLLGSRAYAESCRQQGEQVTAMLALDGLGYYSEKAGSQSYPFPLGFFYPSAANFIAFVGNRDSSELLKAVVGGFRLDASFPCEGVVLPQLFAKELRSDQQPFWEQGYPALLISDTASYRYPHYHTPQDRFDKIDTEKLARVTDGLITVIQKLLS